MPSFLLEHPPTYFTVKKALIKKQNKTKKNHKKQNQAKKPTPKKQKKKPKPKHTQTPHPHRQMMIFKEVTHGRQHFP